MPPDDSSTTPYNATLIALNRIHESLAIFRVVPDGGPFAFQPGQYTVLGLYEVDVDKSVPTKSRLIRRAYSLSCSILDEQGNVKSPGGFPYLEFYVALVPPHGHRPTLTPRLFALQPGDRLYVGPRPKGEYTLRGIERRDNVLFIGTGTGEAPHNAMLSWLLEQGHLGRIAVVTSVRYEMDLAYLKVHRELERRYPRYRYVALATREQPGSTVDPLILCGRRIQDVLQSGDLERQIDLPLDPDVTHIYLCGNPSMIGLPQAGPFGVRVFPKPAGMIELLTERGFVLDYPHQRGRIHVERYW